MSNSITNERLKTLFKGMVQSIDFNKIDVENLDKNIQEIKDTLPKFIGIDMHVLHLTIDIENKQLTYGINVANGEKVFGSVSQLIDIDDYDNMLGAGGLLSTILDKDDPEPYTPNKYRMDIIRLKQKPGSVAYATSNIIDAHMTKASEEISALAHIDNISMQDMHRMKGYKEFVKMLEMSTSAQLVVVTEAGLLKEDK